MASKYWIKLYHEMLDDAKVARLNDSAYRRFIECMLLAGELNEQGFLPPLEDMAWRLRTSETSLDDDMTRLALGGLVERKAHEDGERWFITKFAERQAPSTSAQRVREFRKRKRKEADKKQITDTDIDTDTYSNVTLETKRYTNVTFPQPYDGHAENTRSQEINDIITKICNVVKGADPTGPPDKVIGMAHSILDAGTADRILGFRKWWNDNGHYNGRPAFKSFRDEWVNYLDGVDMTASSNQQITKVERMAQRIEEKYNGMDN